MVGSRIKSGREFQTVGPVKSLQSHGKAAEPKARQPSHGIEFSIGGGAYCPGLAVARPHFTPYGRALLLALPLSASKLIFLPFHIEQSKSNSITLS